MTCIGAVDAAGKLQDVDQGNKMTGGRSIPKV
jgi:hypothetical protein